MFRCRVRRRGREKWRTMRKLSGVWAALWLLFRFLVQTGQHQQLLRGSERRRGGESLLDVQRQLRDRSLRRDRVQLEQLLWLLHAGWNLLAGRTRQRALRGQRQPLRQLRRRLRLRQPELPNRPDLYRHLQPRELPGVLRRWDLQHRYRSLIVRSRRCSVRRMRERAILRGRSVPDTHSMRRNTLRRML